MVAETIAGQTLAKQVISELWWLILLKGIAALILGLLLVSAPGATMVTLALFLGIYWLIDGILSIVRIFVGDSEVHWGWFLFSGILGIIAGVLVLRHPSWAAVLVPTVLVIILGINGLIIGGITLYEGFQGEGIGTIILGILSILFGILLLARPLVGAAALPVAIGILGIIGGIGLIIASFRVRKLASV